MTETTDKLVFAKDINRLRKPSAYKQFDVGYFTNVPDLGGYIYRFKVEDAKIILIVDTAGSKYNKSYYKKDGWHFLIYKCPSIEQFTKQLADNISDIVISTNRLKPKNKTNLILNFFPTKLLLVANTTSLFITTPPTYV